MKAVLSLFTIALAFSIASCQKVINIDLNTKEPKVVIEGEITDDTTLVQYIRITQSVNFSASNSFPAVSGAVVTIKDNMGDSFLMKEGNPGFYQNAALKGYPGRTYYLTVVAGGKTYTASSTMPAKVLLDSITVGTLGFGPGNNVIITPVFHDPMGRGNCYRFKLYDNTKVSSDLYVFDDQAVDGAVNNQPLFTSDKDMKFDKGDTAAVKMMCISQPVFDYFFSLSQNTGGPNESASPANPLTNINGATLGYFSAHTVEVKKVVIR